MRNRILQNLCCIYMAVVAYYSKAQAPYCRLLWL